MWRLYPIGKMARRKADALEVAALCVLLPAALVMLVRCFA